MEQLSSKWIKVSQPFPHVLHVELAHGPVNAFCIEYWKEYGKLFDKLIEEPSRYDVRALVLSSVLPKGFTAGIDLADAGTIASAGANAPDHDAARTARDLKKLILDFQNAITKPAKCPFPVIVAVHGITFGLGVDIIAACDVRFAAEDAVFAIKEVDIGLAADIGSLAYLPKVTGNDSLLRELAYTGRSFSAGEAEKVGLVSRVVSGSRADVVKEALTLSKVIAAKSPIAVSGTKEILNHSRDHSIGENMEYTAQWNSAALITKDIGESLRALKARQQPKFAPLHPTATPSKL